MKFKGLNNCKCLKIFFLSETEILILTTSYVFVSELFWVSLLWIQILICDIFKKSSGAFLSKVNILKGQTMSSGWKKLSDIYGKDDLFWFNIETARNPNSNTSKNCGKNAEGKVGEVPGCHLPCLIPLDPFPCAWWSAGAWAAVQAGCSESPRKCGREDELFPLQDGTASQRKLLFMVVPWQKVLGAGVVFAADKRKCFGIFVLFLMYFSLLHLTVSGKAHLKLSGVFSSAVKISRS